MSIKSAKEQLEALVEEGFSPAGIHEVHDTFKLLGIVLGQAALLEIVANPQSEDTARVAAAKALMSVKEEPTNIAERLRRSAFVGLTVEQLQAIVQRVGKGERDFRSIIKEIKKEPIKEE